MRCISYPLAAFFALLTSAYGDVYPVLFPFENEAELPPAPMAATPTFLYTEEDDGGYYYTGVFMRDEIPMPFAFGYNSGMNWFVFAVAVEIAARPPMKDISVFNCTAKGEDNIIFGADSFPGTFDDYKVCEAGECCPEFQGAYGYWGGAGEDDWERNAMEEEFAAGTCTETIDEPLYCTIMSWGAHQHCLEAFTGPSTRDMDRVVACYDHLVHYYLSCPVYKVAGHYLAQREPEQYTAASTPNELLAGTSCLYSQDKVCHPYSYFFPDFAKSSSDSATSEKSESSDITASSSSPGSQVVIGFTAALLSLYL